MSRSEKSLATNSDKKHIPEETYGANVNDHKFRQTSSFTSLLDKRSTLNMSTLDKHDKVKRNKSFWRFSKSEEILEGMAMWKHRDLIPSEQEAASERMKQSTLNRASEKTIIKKPPPYHKPYSTLDNSNKKAKSAQINKDVHLTKSEIDKRVKQVNQKIKKPPPTKPERNYSREGNHVQQKKKSNDEELYGEKLDDFAVWKENDPNFFYNANDSSKNRSSKSSFEDDGNFFDDESVQEIMLKSIKRKDILKQYYLSGSDSEPNSVSSDPYDCIVVDDHLVSNTDSKKQKVKKRTAKSDTLEFSTFKGKRESEPKMELSKIDPILPRTKLSKGKDYDNARESVNLKKRSHDKQQSGWADLWEMEGKK